MSFKISKILGFCIYILKHVCSWVSDNIRGPLFSDLLSYFKLTNAQGSFSFAVLQPLC